MPNLNMCCEINDFAPIIFVRISILNIDIKYEYFSAKIIQTRGWNWGKSTSSVIPRAVLATFRRVFKHPRARAPGDGGLSREWGGNHVEPLSRGRRFLVSFHFVSTVGLRRIPPSRHSCWMHELSGEDSPLSRATRSRHRGTSLSERCTSRSDLSSTPQAQLASPKAQKNEEPPRNFEETPQLPSAGLRFWAAASPKVALIARKFTQPPPPNNV